MIEENFLDLCNPAKIRIENMWLMRIWVPSLLLDGLKKAMEAAKKMNLHDKI